MIYGIGTDIVKIARLQRSMEQNTRMAQKLFTEAEISYCESSLGKIHLSISHEKDYATAFVVVEKTNS